MKKITTMIFVAVFATVTSFAQLTITRVDSTTAAKDSIAIAKAQLKSLKNKAYRKEMLLNVRPRPLKAIKPKED